MWEHLSDVMQVLQATRQCTGLLHVSCQCRVVCVDLWPVVPQLHLGIYTHKHIYVHKHTLNAPTIKYNLTSSG